MSRKWHRLFTKGKIAATTAIEERVGKRGRPIFGGNQKLGDTVHTFLFVNLDDTFVGL